MIRFQGDETGRHSVALECERCGAQLPTLIRLGAEPFSPAHRNHLRQLAQAAGWYHFCTDIWGQGVEDLCPACYTLPPSA